MIRITDKEKIHQLELEVGELLSRRCQRTTGAVGSDASVFVFMLICRVMLHEAVPWLFRF